MFVEGQGGIDGMPCVEQTSSTGEEMESEITS